MQKSTKCVIGRVGGNKLFSGGYMFAEFDKVVRCLALELPESVHADVVARYVKLKAEVEKFTSTNTARDEIAAADKLCRLYFDIAASCIGEEAVRQRLAAATSPVA